MRMRLHRDDGGGIVVLPVLQSEVVPGWMTNDQFFQGLGFAQSLLGPFFNFAAFLGATKAQYLVDRERHSSKSMKHSPKTTL